MDVDKATYNEGYRMVFKGKQYNAIKSFCEGHDSFVSLPTEYGKSLIFVVSSLVIKDKIILIRYALPII